MVRNYVKKTDGPSWTHETLQKALAAIRNGTTFYAASSQYKIPRATLFDHMSGRRGQKSNSLGRPTALNADTEKTLANLIRIMEKNGFGLSRKEVMELVAEYVKQNNMKLPFKDGIPGYDWFAGFVSRHNLSIKKPQAVEYARKQAADPFVLDDYFNILEETIHKLKLQNKPHRIWNIDETSYCNDPKKTKVVGERGYASTRTTATTGKENTTVLFASNAAGGKGPPFIIFKGKNVWSEWTSPEAYPGTLYTATENGWIESKAFAEFFSKSFIPMLGTTDEPTLLIFDGHSTHIQLAVIETAIQNNVTIIKLPPHTSHLLQPLDLSVFKPFKDKWDDRMMKWQRCNYGQKLSKKEFSIIVGEVWRSLDKKILINGFKKGGIFPLNRTVVSEDKLDQSALKRWKEHKKNTAIAASSTISSPSTLLSISLKKINEDFITCNDASVIHQCHIPSIPSAMSRDSVDIPVVTNQISFEELLISTIKRHESKVTIQKKTKIARGAEIITNLDVIKKLKQKEDEKLKKEDKLKTKQKKTTSIKKNSSKVTEKTTNFISGTRDSLPDHDNPGPSTSNHQLSMSTSSANQETEMHNPKNIIVTSNIRIDDSSKFLKDLNKETMINISDKSILQLKKIRQDTSLSEITANAQNKGLNRVKKYPKKSNEKRGLTKPKKQKIKIKHESSTDESDFSVHDVSDYENENFDDYINSILVDDDYNINNLDMGDEENNIVEVQHYAQSSAKCSLNDWLLVKFASKKTIKHFVGQVKSINNGMPTIKYARKIHKAKKDSVFAYPIIDDICDLKHSEDIVAVLPEPEISRRGHIIFKIHFDTYNVQ